MSSLSKDARRVLDALAAEQPAAADEARIAQALLGRLAAEPPTESPSAQAAAGAKAAVSKVVPRGLRYGTASTTRA